MKGSQYISYLLLVGFFCLLPPQKVEAVPPPEVINNFSAIFFQIFTWVTIFVTSFFYLLKRITPNFIKLNKFKILLGTFLILVISTSLFYYQKNKVLNSQKNLTLEPPKDEITSLASAKDYDVESITTDQLKTMLDQQTDLIVYDARFNEEFEAGSLKGAVKWEYNWDNKIEQIAELIEPNTKVVFFCHDGHRSRNLARLFRKHHANTAYLKGWAMTINKYWQGDAFNPKYINILDKDQAAKLIRNDSLIIDPRESDVFATNPPTEAINIPVSEINFQQTNTLFKERIGNKNNVVIICFDKASCFEANILHYRITTKANENYNIGIFPQGETLDELL